jgi:hypothetical protein
MSNKIQCKYCLESSLEGRDQFISPCDCTGSVKYVHYSCFIRWIILAPEDRKSLCPICNYTYNINPLDDLELIPESPPLFLSKLSHPFLSLVVSHVLFYLVIASIEPLSFNKKCEIYMKNQYTFYSIWLIVFLRSISIKNKALYLHTLLYSYRSYFIVCHIACLILFWNIPVYFFITGPITSSLLQVYWIEHVNILTQVNKEQISLLLPFSTSLAN